MIKYKSPTERFIEAVERTGDIMLRYAYQKQMILDMLTDNELDRIADRVIQRMNLTADASEIVGAIDEINKKLKELGVE